MTDHELLELAAKASGLAGEWSKTLGGWDCLVLTSGNVWQPLHDDGDALRLAVKLQMQIAIFEAECYTRSPNMGQQDWFGEVGDPCATTRRTIVKVAAEIGKQLQD